MPNAIPSTLLKDCYWGSMLHLFIHHPKLRKVFTTKYFDLEAGFVKAQALKLQAKPWSTSEKVMLDLLFTFITKVIHLIFPPLIIWKGSIRS